MAKTVKKSFRETLRLTGTYIKWILLFLLVVYVFSGVYKIDSNQMGVLLRFGRVINANVRPGIHFALPMPIDQVHKVSVKQVHQIRMDDFSQTTDSNSIPGVFYQATGLPSYCISGDNNIVTVDFVIKYMIVDPKKYLFSISNSEAILKNFAAASLIHTIAKLPVDEILTYGKKGIETSLRDEIQQRLDKANCGIGVSFVELKNVSPPGIVQRYFDDVINAGIDRKKMVHQAESYSSEQLAAALADAEKQRQQALAYKKEKIDRAEGDAGRFLSQLKELGASGDVTKKRLYLEFVHSLYPKLENMIIVDSNNNRRLINLKVFPNQKAMDLLYDSKISPYRFDEQ